MSERVLRGLPPCHGKRRRRLAALEGGDGDGITLVRAVLRCSMPTALWLAKFSSPVARPNYRRASRCTGRKRPGERARTRRKPSPKRLLTFSAPGDKLNSHGGMLCERRLE